MKQWLRIISLQIILSLKIIIASNYRIIDILKQRRQIITTFAQFRATLYSPCCWNRMRGNLDDIFSFI